MDYKSKKYKKCDYCETLQPEHVIYPYKIEHFIMLESVCLSCLFKIQKESIDEQFRDI
jgi:MinD superfamily P-loop ATPase